MRRLFASALFELSEFLFDVSDWLHERAMGVLASIAAPEVTCPHGRPVAQQCASCNLAHWQEDAQAARRVH